MGHWRTYDHNLDDKCIKDICYNCGSKSLKATYPFFRRAMYLSKMGGVWCELFGDQSFYFATVARTHIRLIGIAAKDDCKGQGLGKAALYRLLQRMAAVGIDTLTFRTSMHEDAQHFWLKQGAKIMDVKGDDYEMQLKIKL